MRRLLAALALGSVLVGCGGVSTADRDDARAALALAEFNMSQAVVSRDQTRLLNETDSYIALVRKHQDTLGDEESRQRLADMASRVENQCPECSRRLDRALQAL